MPKQKYQTGDPVYGARGKGVVAEYLGSSRYRVMWAIDNKTSEENTSSLWMYRQYDAEDVLMQMKYDLMYPGNRRLNVHDVEVSGDTLYGYCRVDGADDYLLQLTLTPLDRD